MQVLRKLAVGALLAMVAGCTAAVGPGEINDPHEATNRRVHAFNVGLDKGVVRPVSQGYGAVVPEPARMWIKNFSNHLSLPGIVLNDLLQARPGDAFHNTGRFVINTTFGLGGTLDVATEMDLPVRDSDFGETLHVWGFPEGAYQELPLLGPSTERDTAGRIVDFAMNPTRHILSDDQRDALTGVNAAARIGDRHEHSELIDSILYDSADSYAQARLLYLQNRRFKLNDKAEEEYFDPYEDPYAE